MNEKKSRQGEGYDYYDYDELAFNAVGGAEVAYVVGTNARAAVPNAAVPPNTVAPFAAVPDWQIWPISEVYGAPYAYVGALPHEAQNTLFWATQECVIRLVNKAMITRHVMQLTSGIPVVNAIPWPIPTLQITIPATTWITLPDKWCIIYAVGTGVAGILTVKTSG